MVANVAVDAFVSSKMEKKINLAVCYFLMTVSSLTLLMPAAPAWLSIGTRRER